MKILLFKLSLPKVLFIIFVLFIFTDCQNEQEKESNKKLISMTEKTDIPTPKAAKKPHEMTVHDHTRTDNYYWMRLSDEQKNAETPDTHTQEVLDYLNTENDYTKNMMSHLLGFQDKLYEEIVGRIKKDDASVPYKDNGYFYYTRYEGGQEYPLHCRKKENLEAEESVLLNVNELAKPYDYFAVGSRSVSEDNKILAYGEDTLSRRIYTIRFKNLETGKMLEDVIPNTTGRAIWANDNKTVFYNVKDETLRSFKVFKHVLGTDASQDEEVYHEEDSTFSCYVYKQKSKKYLTIASFQTVSSEYWMLDANNPEGEWKVIQPRERNLEYSVSHFGDKFFIRTNLDAKNFRLMETSESSTTKENWKEVIPNRDDIFLEGMEIFNDYLVIEERIKGIRNIRIIPNEGAEHHVDFGEDAFVVYPTLNRDYDTDIIRLSYTSMTTPRSTFDYNMKTKELKLLKEQPVLGGFDKNNYSSERIYAEANDKTKIPISLVYRKGTPTDGTAPVLLYGYGSYGASMEPSFSSIRLSLLDRGFIYAIAHIRGGEELGRQWYEDGKLLKKKNTFTDFINCGEYLIANKYAHEDKLFAMGGSAGGLLMGAVANMKPGLWKGIVSAVPFVDVVTTMLDESIPLTTGEFDEWGNPKTKEYYDYMLSYSPYDQLEAKDYPAMLVTTGLHDSQVQYWEPAKYMAKLRDLKTDNNPLMLHTNMDAGHGGQSGRFRRYKEVALEYSFILDLVGLAEIKG